MVPANCSSFSLEERPCAAAFHFWRRMFNVAGITLAQAQAKLDQWMAADDALSRSQSYSIDGRTLTRADAGEVQSRIVFWDNQVKRLSRGGIRMTGGVPL